MFLYEFDFDGAPEPSAMNVEFGLSHAGELIYTFGAFRQTEAYNRPWAEDFSRMFHSTVRFYLKVESKVPIIDNFSDLMNGRLDNLWSPFSMSNQAFLSVANNNEKDLIVEERLNPLDSRSERAVQAWKRYASMARKNNSDSFWRELCVTFFTNLTDLVGLLFDILFS